jgi:DNA repair protein RadC
MTYGLRVTDLPPSERPRERLLESGATHLAMAELLAILLGTGQGAGGLSAIGLAQHMLQILGRDRHDPLAGLEACSLGELTAIKGVGPAKAATILAALELGRRVFQRRRTLTAPLSGPADAAAELSLHLSGQAQERFAVLLLDVKNRPVGTQLISIGSATETIAHPREVFREAIRQGATRLIVGHNHPSGEVEPSPQDLGLTRQLLQAGQILSIPLLDHLILGHDRFNSLRESSLLWQEYPQGA